MSIAFKDGFDVLDLSVPIATTASSTPLKKRKLAPFVSTPSLNTARTSIARFDSAAFQEHRRSPITSSPPPRRASPAIDGTSPDSTTAHSSPFPGETSQVIPSHVTADIRNSTQRAYSPSGAFAQISIENNGSSMSGSENGKEGYENRSMMQQRSVSPAKRSVVEMEDITNDSQPTDTQVTLRDADQLDTLPNSVTASSIEEIASANTSTTSFDRSPSLSTKDDNDEGLRGVPEPIPGLEEQVRQVTELRDRQLEEGSRGVVVSYRWLGRVLSRTTEGLKSSDYAKDAREGAIGPLDNADIVPTDGFSEPILKDRNGAAYIPLRDGLRYGLDIEILPYDAYGKIVGWYGAVQGQKMIVRYAHNTAPLDAPSANIQYELYPPVMTIRKLITPKPIVKDNDKTRSALLALKVRQEQRGYGQMSPDDAVRVVSSRFEKYQKFLTRAKEHAEVPIATKVKVWRAVSQSDTEHVSKQLDLVVEKTEFDMLENASRLELIEAPDQTANEKYNGSSNMETVQLFADQTLILVEQPGNDSERSHKADLVKTTTKTANTDTGRNSTTSGIMTRGRIARSNRTRGTVGLTNLGNTCYMNSALQCIRSVEELAIYFLMGQYKKEINASNPIGYKGAMATRYAEVVRGIYNESASGAFSPSGFKSTLARHATIFSGFGQQDSQEFLSFLVDALHEDLNRIEKKPFLENPDSDDNRVNDKDYIIELGNTYRNNHYARNASIAMDLFSGFYKNTMECPICDKVSVTFDPYSSLTLQLPISNTFTHGMAFVPLRGQPVTHDVDMEKNTTIRELKQYIGAKHGITDPTKLWMIEVYSHKIYRVFEDSTSLADANIQNNDYIFIYELEYAPTYLPVKSTFGRNRDPVPDMDADKSDILTVPIIHRHAKTTGAAAHDLHPQYISLTREEAKDLTVVRKKVLATVAQLTSRPFLMAEVTSVDSEDAAVVSDHSEPSEDDYVNVSMNKQYDQPQKQLQPGQIPADFMNPEYDLSESLANMMFTLNYARSSEGGHCASLGSYEDRSVRPIKTRVKLPSRRSSVASTSTETTDDLPEDDSANGEDIVPTPGTADTPSVQGDTTEEDTDVIPAGRRINTGKGNKFKSGAKGRKEKNLLKRQEKNKRQAKTRELTPISPDREDEDNEYYIRTGECLLVDWHSEAFDQLFGGKGTGDARGHFLSDSNGAGLPVIEDAVATEKRAARERRKKHGIALKDCFSETGKREKLSEDNAWYCNRCKELRQATKTLEIWTLPDILVLHLKRFGGNRRFNDKIDVLVDYPVEGLELDNVVGLKEEGKDYVYDLFAIDNHYGGTGGGHYTAQAKSFIDGSWYDYNDSSCTKLGEAPKRSAAAYLLFYRRRSDKPLGPPYLQELVSKFRNVDNAAEESDSGEELLGGPISTLRGSSSNSAAGVTATTGQGLAVNADGFGAEHHQKTSRSLTTIDDDDGPVVYGPAKPLHLAEYREETPAWGFDGLSNAETQLDDNDSTKAEADVDMSSPEPATWNDNETSFNIGDDSALHLEDAGAIGDDHELDMSSCHSTTYPATARTDITAQRGLLIPVLFCDTDTAAAAAAADVDMGNLRGSAVIFTDSLFGAEISDHACRTGYPYSPN
ncbi:hypothetical protein AMS68_006608 [Peltaster fructicola]|uniref:ubiquitinyl hydrolase 1 n=1 Tax=Peltaster fructicola TaxID=286661 RepID=A0A6H0Y2E7_9PEZI|nr:hypothetical protein AMS68_006608 [Peltaster fructicola]